MSEEVRPQMGSVKVKKFPIWGLCSRCNALSRFDSNSSNQKCRNTRVEPKREGKFTPCGQIKNSGKIEPVRFVGYCGKGHIEDFPWVKMMQRKCSPNCDMHNRSHTVNQPSLYLADILPDLSADNFLLLSIFEYLIISALIFHIKKNLILT